MKIAIGNADRFNTRKIDYNNIFVVLVMGIQYDTVFDLYGKYFYIFCIFAVVEVLAWCF